MTSSSVLQVTTDRRIAKWLLTASLPILLATPAFADCGDDHSRGDTAKKVEFLFKNETEENIDLIIETADAATPNNRETVQTLRVEAGRKSDFTQSLGDNEEMAFYVSFSGLSGDFLVANDKSNTANGVVRKSKYFGTGLRALSEREFIQCETKFKSNRQRWSISLQVDERRL